MSRIQRFPFAHHLAFTGVEGAYWHIECDGKTWWHYDKGRAIRCDDPFAVFPDIYWPVLTDFCIAVWLSERGVDS